MEEYDFRNDRSSLNIDIDLKANAKVRPYQKGPQKMFGNGGAKSGVIVLPCGAGKSLVGVTAACTIKKPTLVLCTSTVSVEQWRGQFATWITITEDRIGKCVSASDCSSSDRSFCAEVTVSTYSMISHTGKRSKESQVLFDQIKNKEWGLLLLDEVYMEPADMFRKVIDVAKAHCKLGLTATLLREDDKIQDVNFLIGPKLYEANWLDLQKQNYLASVKCTEVWCPMTQELYQECFKLSSTMRARLCGMNPTKFQACQHLVRDHENRGHKIINNFY